MKPTDIYLRLTDANGNSTYSEHRVWDKEMFLSRRIAYFETHRNEDERRAVTEINVIEFRQATGKKCFA